MPGSHPSALPSRVVNALAPLLAAESQGSPLGILILIVPFGLLIWLMVVPQRKQKARQQQLISSLSVGDEVMTTGGIVGQIRCAVAGSLPVGGISKSR